MTRSNQLKFLISVLLLTIFQSPVLAQAPKRLIIDTDAACERDDQQAIVYALLSQDKYEVVGITAVHNGDGTLDKNFLEIHNLIGLMGLKGIPVFKGAGMKMADSGTPVESDGARFIIREARKADTRPLTVLGIGAATNLASAVLIDSSIKGRATFAWLGGVDWPNGEGGEHNMLQDIAAARVLFGSGLDLKYIPCGNNMMITTKYISGDNLRDVSPIGNYLQYLMQSNRWPLDEPFNIADMTAIGALLHPEQANWSNWLAPQIDDNGGYDWTGTGKEITVVTGLNEQLDGSPRPIWDDFYAKVKAAAPPKNDLRETLCDILHIHPNDPGVQPVEGEIEQFDGFTRQHVEWPTIGGERCLAYVCRPTSVGSEPLPAVICLSGTGGDRIVLTSEEFGILPYTSIGRDNPHTRLHGWASELARRGYVTLALTQRALGDRRLPSGSASKSLMLRGEHFQGQQAYEIRQALTYLASRKDVDGSRIAATGMSFGGITTFFSTAVDNRFKAAAPLCGGVGSLRQMLAIGETTYHGHYWWIPEILLYFDMGDIVAAQAPRPYFIAAPLQDIGMPAEGVNELEAKAMPAYIRNGVPTNLRIYRPDDSHSFTLEMFEELVRFFNDYL